MAITVQIPTALRRHTDGVGKLDCSAANISELFSVLDEKFPQLKPHLRDEAGEIRRFLNVYVNEEDIRFLGGPAWMGGTPALPAAGCRGNRTILGRSPQVM